MHRMKHRAEDLTVPRWFPLPGHTQARRYLRAMADLGAVMSPGVLLTGCPGVPRPYSGRVRFLMMLASQHGAMATERGAVVPLGAVATVSFLYGL